MTRKNKKGLSEIVTMVLFLALAVVMVGIVWTAVNGLVNKKLSGAGSCFDTAGKVSINGRYTCYNSSTKEFQFSINVGDIILDEIIVGISGSGTSTSLRINNGISQVANLVSYPDRNASVTLPKENAGLTYLFDMQGAGFTGAPDSIRISPVIGTDQCETSDSLEEVVNCQSLIP